MPHLEYLARFTLISQKDVSHFFDQIFIITLLKVVRDLLMPRLPTQDLAPGDDGVRGRANRQKSRKIRFYLILFFLETLISLIRLSSFL